MARNALTGFVGGLAGRVALFRATAPRAVAPQRGLRVSAVSMKLTTGIVGCPNVGKSTLMNALVEGGAALAGNYPFCTVEPNVGIAAVPDSRLDVLGEINQSAKTVSTTLEFVDIAGLVAGASKGEGLGNKFLASIRECDAIVHVCRCFDDDNIIHVAGSVDPLRDIEVINLELGLADLAQVEKRLRKARVPRGGKSDADPNEVSALEKIMPVLDAGGLARLVDLTPEEAAAVKPLGLLTMKPVVYAANVADSELATGNGRVDAVREYAAQHGDKVVIVSAQVESELVELSAEEKTEFLEALDVKPGTTGLSALVGATYDLLGLRTYFTSGPTETRAWTITAGMRAPQAAGVIHGDVR
jgi:ribosome-binding ATPase